MPIVVGKRRAAIFYTIVSVAVYLWIIAWSIAGVIPLWTLISLLTLPFTIKAIDGAMHNDIPAKLMPGMAANIMSVLVTQLLLGIGFILGRAF